MTCDQAIELLPWYLNGTLEAGERAEVQRHLETCDRCREALAETRAAWKTFAQHLTPRDMVALAWDQPTGLDPELVREHLASCPECAAELGLTWMSRQEEKKEDNVVAFRPRLGVKETGKETAAPSRWRRAALAAGLTGLMALGGWFYEGRRVDDLSHQLAAVRTAPQPGAPAAAPQPQAPADSALRDQLAGLTQKVERLTGLQTKNEKALESANQQIAELTRPQGTALVDLSTGDVVRSGEGLREVRSDRYSTLLLVMKDAGPGPLTAEIANPAGKVVARTPALPYDSSSYTAVLPPGSLKPGTYTLRIPGREDRWTFRVVKP